MPTLLIDARPPMLFDYFLPFSSILLLSIDTFRHYDARLMLFIFTPCAVPLYGAPMRDTRPLYG